MIRLGVIGTGGMANAHANEFAKIAGVKLVAACDVDHDRASAYAKKHGIPRVYDDVDEMLADKKIDAVTNVTPDAFHAPISLKIIAAGKHVLCEKPLATNYPDALKMTEAAKAAGVINMVNLSYRNSSALQKAALLIEKGEIGRIVHVEASYLQGWLGSKNWGDWRSGDHWLWRLSTSHGSKGVLGDIGVHIIDFATFPAGPIKRLHCKLKTFSDIKGTEYNGYALDANDFALITAELENGALATISTTRWAVGQPNSLRLRVYGDKGGIRLDLDESYTTLEICRGRDVDKAAWKTLDCPATPNIYQRFAKSVRTGKNDQPDFARGAEVQKALDACLESDKRDATVEV